MAYVIVYFVIVLVYQFSQTARNFNKLTQYLLQNNPQLLEDISGCGKYPVYFTNRSRRKILAYTKTGNDGEDAKLVEYKQQLVKTTFICNILWFIGAMLFFVYFVCRIYASS